MRIVSPNFMKSVNGLPSWMVSMARFSAMQLYPLGHSVRPLDSTPLLLTVPEPTMEPARTLRVLQMCAINWPK